jgi:hypothetical protein
MTAAPFGHRLAAMNGAAQSAFAGAYAWAVTVAPAAWARGAGPIAKVFALVALIALGAGFTEARFGERVRRVALWGFVFACAIVWSAVPSSLGVLRVDALRGLAGVLGWALVGLTLAAPARSLVEAGVARSRALAPRQVLVPGDRIYLWTGALVAGAIQAVGWSAPSAERSLLVRFAVLAAGMAIVATSADLALARHLPRTEPSPRRRLDSAVPTLVTLGLLVLVGALFAVRGW